MADQSMTTTIEVNDWEETLIGFLREAKRQENKRKYGQAERHLSTAISMIGNIDRIDPLVEEA